MIKLITGNHAAAYGVALARPKVIAAYPITPQTTIIEHLSSFCADGTLEAKFMTVESEHSAMAACVGASAVGVRVFTATASHGLALMHEMLHIASFMRMPIVMVVVNRSLGPWNVHTDQTDSLSQRDTGWLQFYCEDNQEVLDTVIQAYKISERISLPSMVIEDAFVLSHTSEIVEIPDTKLVDSYLGEYNPPHMLNVEDPRTFGACPVGPDYYLEFRYMAQKAMEDTIKVSKEADEEFKELFSRGHGLIEEYRTEKAELILVTSGTVTSTARLVIDERRDNGESIGLLKVRMFRPFPICEIQSVLSHVEKVAVIDRNISLGKGGIFAEEIKSALCNLQEKPLLYSFVVGLGGRDITPEVIHKVIDYALVAERPEQVVWGDVRQ
ncbi:pyruvate ferredoxin oxidoreductase [Chloroflexota bacterium]